MLVKEEIFSKDIIKFLKKRSIIHFMDGFLIYLPTILLMEEAKLNKDLDKKDKFFMINYFNNLVRDNCHNLIVQLNRKILDNKI